MPVNLRTIEKMDELGNQFGLIFLSLPVGIADPLERLAELSRRSQSLKRSVEPVVVFRILKRSASCRAVQDLVVKIFATKATAVMTNVPGPREELYLAGEPIRDFSSGCRRRAGWGSASASSATRATCGSASARTPASCPTPRRS